MPVAQQISGVVWGLLIGAGLIVVIAATIIGAWSRRPADDIVDTYTGPPPTEPVHEYAGSVGEAHGPIPVIVKLVIAGVLIWSVVYAMMFAQAGFNFS